MAALTPYEKELFEIVVSRVAGSDNDSVIANAVTQVLSERKVPGPLGYLKWLLTRRILEKNRRVKKTDTRPAFKLKAV